LVLFAVCSFDVRLAAFCSKPLQFAFHFYLLCETKLSLVRKSIASLFLFIAFVPLFLATFVFLFATEQKPLLQFALGFSLLCETKLSLVRKSIASLFLFIAFVPLFLATFVFLFASAVAFVVAAAISPHRD
jgi:hypothetical protein